MKTFWMAAAAVSAVAASSAQATVYSIDQGSRYSATYDNGGMGNGRGVSFLANSAFSITSVGVDLNVLAADATQFRYDIFASINGTAVGALLASTSFGLAVGTGYRDQALAFNFAAGSYYIVNFRRVDGSALGGNLGTQYVYENTPRLTYGPFTVIEGFEGATPNAANPLIALTRLNVVDATAAVPEPATWAMMMLGFGGMGYALRRKAKVSTRIRFA